MSGLFLTCWDFTKGSWDEALRATKGGWPHITLVYTGRTLEKETLKKLATEAFVDWADTSFTLTHAYVNSFQLGSGVWRHDCLLSVDVATKALIKIYREERITQRFPLEVSSKFSMNEPHVTAGIFTTVEEAQACVDSYNKSVVGGNPPLLPRTIGITGVTI